MKTNKTIKQITITQKDIVELVYNELINLERIEESDYQENLYESVTFEFIQSHCNKDIEQVLKNFKTGIDDMELDEFEFWLGFHLKRYPYTHNEKQIINNFIDFKEANDDFDPVCLRDKYWEFIKLDLIDFVNNL